MHQKFVNLLLLHVHVHWNITLTVADGALLVTTLVVPVDSTAVVPLAAEFIRLSTVDSVA